MAELFGTKGSTSPFPPRFSFLHSAIARRLRSGRGPAKYRCRSRTRADCADRESSRPAQLAADALLIPPTPAELGERIPARTRSPASFAWPSLEDQHVEREY